MWCRGQHAMSIVGLHGGPRNHSSRAWRCRRRRGGCAIEQRPVRRRPIPVLKTARPSILTILREALRGAPQDLTALPPQQAVLLLAVPMVLEMSMESLFAVVDIFWVSKLGSDAVALVGVTEGL